MASATVKPSIFARHCCCHIACSWSQACSSVYVSPRAALTHAAKKEVADKRRVADKNWIVADEKNSRGWRKKSRGWKKSKSMSLPGHRKIPYAVITFLFFVSPSFFKVILRTAELSSLCNVASSIYQLFVPHFAMAVSMCFYLHYRINKQRDTS